MPKVSAIVPNYNHARFLRKRLESILEQSFQDFELIILDDGSTDESRTILREYASDPRVRLEFNEVNSGGVFRQWNKGVGLARGEYVWMAESDDYADKGFLNRLVAVLDDEPAAAFVYCRSWRVTEDGRVDGFGDWYLDMVDAERWKSDFCVDGQEQFLRYFSRCCVVANASAVLFRRAVYERIGGADESFRVCGDWKVWTAMTLAGKVAFVNEPLNYYRLHKGSVLHQSLREGENIIEALAVVRWILNQAKLPQAVLSEVYPALAEGWVPALMSMHSSLRQKRAIWRHISAVDPHPFRRVAGPMLRTAQRKFLRHWREVRPMARGREV